MGKYMFHAKNPNNPFDGADLMKCARRLAVGAPAAAAAYVLGCAILVAFGDGPVGFTFRNAVENAKLVLGVCGAAAAGTFCAALLAALKNRGPRL
jgi:hypothetical protein